MKRITLLFALVVGFALTVHAQEQGLIRAGAGLVLGTKSGISDTGGSKSGIGINIGGEYFATDIISVAASYTTFFKSEIGVVGAQSSVKYNSLNIDGRYYFDMDGIQLYGLAGLSFASFKSESTIDFFGLPNTTTFTDSKTGLNIGGGIVLPLADKIGFNGQLKYNTPLEQIALGAGVFYTF